MINPCCGCGLKTGTKLVAVHDMVISLVHLILIFCELRFRRKISLVGYDEKISLSEIVFALIYSVYCIVTFVLGIFLFIATAKKDFRQCTTWLIISVPLHLIAIIVAIIVPVLYFFVIMRIICFLTILTLLIRLYLFWVVHAFIQDLQIGTTPTKLVPLIRYR